MLFDEIAGQEQVGQNIVGGGFLNLNQGGYVQGYEDGGMAKTGYNKGGMYNGYKDGGLIDMKQFGRRIL